MIHHHTSLATVGLALVFALSACGSSGPTATTTTGSGTSAGSATGPETPAASSRPSAAANNAVVDPCTLISPADAAAVLGGAAHVVTRAVAGDPIKPCTYAGDGARGGFVIVSDIDKDHYPGSKGPDTLSQQLRSAADAAAAKTGATVMDVPGVGDSAFLLIDSRKHSAGLTFVKGSIYVSVAVVSSNNPPTVASMVMLGKLADSRL